MASLSLSDKSCACWRPVLVSELPLDLSNKHFKEYTMYVIRRKKKKKKKRVYYVWFCKYLSITHSTIKKKKNV